ncbi:BTAD domain-containing putative transcriptional regulator [Streptomyces sp. NPDC001595]|uniref:AfsR/SARP family transcriptional regulator n=1 Tax=Streptomyces sp. NPDC001532 TaxID=3154520 RepID=UPI0033335395
MEAAKTPAIHFSVLGRFLARRGDTDIDLGSPQQRAVAAVLVMRHGRAVSIDDLAAALWETPPRRPEPVLRTYVWRLRHLLEPARDPGRPWQMLQSVPGGYSFRLAEGALDRELFEQHVAEARARKAAGEVAAARNLFDAALSLWRDTTLLGVPGPFANAERARLEERRLDVVEARLETMVELGDCADAATELTTLAETHPLREGLHFLLMRALHRTGRQGEALAVYRRAHRLLARELGIEPNARLQQLHADILQDTAPSVPRPEIVTRQERAPRQIPHATADFTGRTQETRLIRETLLHPSAEAVPIVLVTGMGGTGKTSLVMHSVQSVLSTYPDGQLYVDLRGADGTPADPATVLTSFLRALGERDAYIPAELYERAALYRSRLAQRRVLIVLDNAADMDQVTPLLPGGPTCAVVITSRNGLATLPVSARVILGAMPDEDAMRLLTRLIGASRVDAEPHTARSIVTACGGLPLAVRIIGSRLAARPEWTLADLAARLTDEQHRLAELTVDTVTVEASFALGYGQLNQSTRQSLRLLALPAHSVYDLRTASTVLAVPAQSARVLLERLVAVGLLESPALDRYRYHDLVRLFARRLALETDPDRTRHAALGRLLDLHLVAAAESYRVIRPGHTVALAALPVVPGTEVCFDSVNEALNWSASALDDILLLLTQTAASHTDRAATLLLMLDAVLHNAHLWHQVIPVATVVADAASRAGDRRSEGRARYILGGALAEVGRTEQASDQLARALEASRDRDDDVQAMCLNAQGFVIRVPDSALQVHREAADLAQRLNNRSLEALVLGNAVQVRLTTEGMDERTVAESLRHIELYRLLRDRQGQALSLYRHGQVLVRQGLPADAIADYQQALRLIEDGEIDFVRAACLVRLSEAYTQVGRLESAVKRAEEGLLLARAVRHGVGEAHALRALGDALLAMDQRTEAVRVWRDSLAIFEHLGAEVAAAAVEKRLAGVVSPLV